MAASPRPSFHTIWRDDRIRSGLLSELDLDSMCSLRLVDTECGDYSTKPLFKRTRLTLTPSSLTRPSRIEALRSIGPYIEHLTFSMPHTPDTFLPPLLNPLNGREVNFLYTPHTTRASVKERPKYGCSELGDLLTQQYPPIFHAATNVPAFVHAFGQMPNLRHLTIDCPGQDPAQRYRRGCVDYALISLRIAIERAPLGSLEKLSLAHIHAAGLQYLRHFPGYGCTPSAGRRWKQIKKLSIVMDSWDFLGPQPGLDHLKILDDYVRNFSGGLEKISFGWNGRKGPCPLTLFTDPLFAPPRRKAKLFAEVTSPMSPLPEAPRRPPMRFPKLRYMQIRNASMSSDQVADFVFEHRRTVKEFDFENVMLINGDVWEDALAPLTRISGGDEWRSQQSSSDVDSFTQSQEQLDYLDDLEEVIDTLSRSNSRDPPIDVPLMIETSSSVHATKIKKRVRRRKRRAHKEHKELKDYLEKPLISPPKASPPSPPRPKISRPFISGPLPTPDPFVDVLLPTTTFNPNVQGVQRDLERDAAQQLLVDDPEKRVSTLKKAKEAVLASLSKEFCRGQGKKKQKSFFKNTCSSGWKSSAMLNLHESRTALVPLMFSRY
ncbi:hypothetical protein BJ875DRAFT_291229 [Amylocarpus encephaloides]|uniref:Uncharacterized protein n=1 Tax=Amylocarpus encephaloides TaxID=45428 RepID=A0A9P7YJU5_9HELO|nr:hypothetical protein BJ875DRAFT_291229 [Amylocarpus encephaloides]